MEFLTKENIGIFLGIIGAIPVFKGSLIFLTSWNKKRKAAAIEKEIFRITKLRDSDRELYLFIFRSLLFIAALFAISIMISSVTVPGISVIQFANGTFAYLVSLYTLGYINRVRTSKRVLAELQAKLEKIKSGL
ncbi:MAG: hypothetical protein Q7U91_14660 [Sideroxyarcus sp.]|nr:hypothetical protein [Sideroxyarcus sp.]